MGVVRKLAARWLEFEAKRILEQVLPGDTAHVPDIRIDQILSTGHRRKIIATRGDRKYICQLALRHGYCTALSELHNLARKNDVPLAPVLGAGTCWRGIIPVHYIVLDWMPGSPCNNKIRLNQHQLTELGRIFGRLHAISSDQWETAGMKYPTRFDNVDLRQDRWASFIRKLCAFEEESLNDRGKEALAWMRQESAFLKSLSRYSLVHGDPHGNNVLLGKDQLSLIDTDQMRFDFAPFELFRCLLANYNEFDLERQTAFLQGYRETVDRMLWKMWEEHKIIVAATVFLQLANQKLIQSRSLDDPRRKALRSRRAMSYWRTFLRLAEHPGQVGNLERMIAVYWEEWNSAA